MALSHALLIIFSLIIASTTATTYTSPSPAPAPAPSHHHHRHHLPGGHHRHNHSHAPAHAPTSSYPKPPTQAPAKPPTYHSAPPPAKPPTYHPAPPAKAPVSAPPAKAPAPYHPVARKLVAVQGVVYCKNCSYAGVNTLLGSSPLPGVNVVLKCKNTKYLMKYNATTDKNGYFFLQAPPQITTYGAHKCLMSLAQKHRPNNGPCSQATNLNGGVSGASLFLDKSGPPPKKPLPFTVFTVGPFAYEPPVKSCHKD